MEENNNTLSVDSNEAQLFMRGTQASYQFTPQKVVQHSDSCNASSGDTVDKLLRIKPVLQRQHAVQLQPDQARQFMESSQGGSPTSSNGSARSYHTGDTTNNPTGSCRASPSNGCREKSPTLRADVIEKDSCIATQASAVVILPKRYDGTSCWLSYKLHFLSCADSNGWTDSERCSYLKAKLTGRAVLVLAQANKWDLHTLLQALDTRFGVAAPDYVIKGKIRRLVQLENQTLNDYADTLVCAVTNRPENEVAERKAILEQFKFGIRDIHVKHYVCKREPTNLNEALKHANDRVAIDNWLAETEYLRVLSQDKVNELCSENERLRQENLLLKRSPPATMPYVATTPSGNNATEVARRSPTTSVVAETYASVVARGRPATSNRSLPPRTISPMLLQRSPVVARGAEELFSEEDAEPPDRTPRRQLPVKRKNDDGAVQLAKRPSSYNAAPPVVRKHKPAILRRNQPRNKSTKKWLESRYEAD